MNKYLMLGAAVAGLGVAYLLYRGALKGAEAAQAVNPFNNDNIINQGATSVYQAVTGSTGTIGTDLYDATHGGALDPTSNQNVVSKTFNGMWGAVTGDPNFNLGHKIYDWTH